jgi:beta-galactosidase
VSWNLAADKVENVYIAAGQLATGFASNDPLLGAHKYGSDNFFVGGELPAIVGFSSIGLSGAVVVNGLGSTAIPETGRVWDMWREGATFGYRIPVPNGSYRVTLGFLEPTVTAANARRFNVSANGVVQIANLDVFQSAGARNTAIARTFAVNVGNGTLALDFAGVTGKAIVSNIAVVKQ